MRYPALRLTLLSALTLGILLQASAPASAHIRDQFEGVTVVLGWAQEPAFAGLPNAVQLILTEPGQPQETPVDPQQVQLTVRVVFGDRDGQSRTEPMALTSFRFGRPGEFRTEPISPTRPGTYTFHVTGSIKGKPFDRAYTSGEKGAIAGTKFNDIQELGPVSFPQRDPSNRELALAIERLEETAAGAGRRGEVIGAVGAVLGLAAIGLALRRRSGA